MTEADTRVRGGKSRTRAAQLKSVSLNELLKEEPLKRGGFQGFSMSAVSVQQGVSPSVRRTSTP